MSEVPENWKLVAIGDILTLGSGRDYKHLENGEIPVYGTGGYMTSVNDYLYDGESVGIGRKGTIDKPVFLKGKFWTVDTLFYTHSFRNVLPFFVYILFQSINWRKYSEATGVPSLSRSIIEPIKIILPPLPEQQKIANILSTVDAKIEIISQQITETQELKKGLMQRLLTKGIGHTEFKDSPLGEIPKSWGVVKIEKIADVKGGKRLPKGESLLEEKTSHAYIRVADMFMGGVSLEKILYVPESIFPRIQNYTISKDDLFISVAGTLGVVGQIPNELNGANLTENANKLMNIKMNKSFLLQVLLSPIIQSAIEREKTNNAQPKLALTRIRAFEVPKPPKEEQEKITSILSSVDEKLDLLSEKKINYQELKQGLMQQLLTGKVRVKL